MAWNLRRLRAERGLSQERLADEAGVDRKYVGMLERQENSVSVDTLDRLAAVLSVELTIFFTHPLEGSAPPKPLRPGRKSA